MPVPHPRIEFVTVIGQRSFLGSRRSSVSGRRSSVVGRVFQTHQRNRMNTWVANVTDELIDARLRAGDVVRFTITTASMQPTLAPGDQVSVRRARATELRAGDIVIIKLNADAARLAHRLIARRVAEDGVRFVTKGDNCAAPDPLWTESQLCGIVTAVWRQDARAPTDLRSTRARWLGMLLACVSRVQARAFALPPGGLRRAALKASWILMQSSARTAQALTQGRERRTNDE